MGSLELRKNLGCIYGKKRAGSIDYRGMERPEGTGSLNMTIAVDLVRMSGTLTEANKLSVITRQRMKNMGIISKQCLKGAVV